MTSDWLLVFRMECLGMDSHGRRACLPMSARFTFNQPLPPGVHIKSLVRQRPSPYGQQ